MSKHLLPTCSINQLSRHIKIDNAFSAKLEISTLNKRPFQLFDRLCWIIISKFVTLVLIHQFDPDKAGLNTL